MGSRRKSRGAHRSLSQKATRLGSAVSGHSGHDASRVQVAALKASTWSALTPTTSASFGVPQIEQHPGTSARHSPGIAQAA